MRRAAAGKEVVRSLLPLITAIGLCRAQQPCTWLNQATASGVLESAATLTATKSMCSFSAKSGDLRIEVTVTPDAATKLETLKAACKGGAKPLKTIGNEAATCTAAGTEQVLGRVRDQLFVITLTMKGFKQEEIAHKSHLVAEQVSGNLF